MNPYRTNGQTLSRYTDPVFHLPN